MAYTIVKSDGTVLTTIPDGTINTTSTSIGLPGRNYAGYGQTVDTNFVHQLENFASSSPPANPVRGQLWYNTNTSTMYVCPIDGESNAAAWTSLATTSSGGATTFGTVTVTGNVSANNVTATTSISTASLSTTNLSTTGIANIANVNVSANANVTGTLKTTVITSGTSSTAGSITGTWTITGGLAGNAAIVNGGNVVVPNVGGFGIVADHFYYANGTPISFTGTYSNTNASGYLTTYNANVGSPGLNSVFNGRTLTTGANTTTGTITGNWSLSTGSRLNATYADLAERQHADAEYAVGTVVKIGGTNDVTCVTEGDDSRVIGVVSSTHAFLMNTDAGSDQTHPPIGLIGRLPVRIVGPVNKHDKIKTSIAGCAVSSTDDIGFGYALETNLDETEKLVICLLSSR